MKNLTPQEKGDQLIEKMMYEFMFCVDIERRRDASILASISTVEEILKLSDKLVHEEYEYWEQVLDYLRNK